jgi:mannose-6-phosphate isomerase-like protein (cupin superfamily)
MRLRTIKEAWVVPPDGAIYIPAGTQHTFSMHGKVDMRTLYIDANTTHPHTKVLSVVAVSNYLRELILAFKRGAVRT